MNECINLKGPESNSFLSIFPFLYRLSKYPKKSFFILLSYLSNILKKELTFLASEIDIFSI